jgi:hypothetical protein
MRAAAPLVLVPVFAACASTGRSDADRLLDETEQAARNARAVHVSGTVADEGETLAIDVYSVNGAGAKGKLATTAERCTSQARNRATRSRSKAPTVR